MKPKDNCIDDIAMILLGGEMEQNKSKAESMAMQKLNQLNDINLAGKQGRTFLIHCCAYEYYDLAKIAVKKGADVNLQDKDGFTPLHIAVKSENIALVEFLLKHGALPNIKNRYGSTPAFDASNNWPILKLLLDYGCDVFSKNFYGVSAYDLILLHPDTFKQFHEYSKQHNL